MRLHPLPLIASFRFMHPAFLAMNNESRESTSLNKPVTFLPCDDEISRQAFMECWNKLPDELKVHVLSFRLAFDNLPSRCKVWGDMTSRTHLEYYHYLLKPFIRTTKDIFKLAQQVYYRDNCIVLRSAESWTSAGPVRFFAYPQPPVNRWLRTVQLQLHVNRDDWRFLQRMANIEYGFENLAYVDLILTWSSLDWCKDRHSSYHVWETSFDHAKMGDFFRNYVYPGVYFKANGRLTFECAYGTEELWGSMKNLSEGELYDAEAALWECVVFGVESN